MIFLFTFVTFNQQTAGLEKKSDSLEWPAHQDKRVDGPNISVSWTGTKLGPNMYFVNKQLTDISKIFKQFGFLTWFWTATKLCEIVVLYRLKGLKLKNKGHMNFLKDCDLMKKYI